jgi:hypothetical protein
MYSRLEKVTPEEGRVGHERAFDKEGREAALEGDHCILEVLLEDKEGTRGRGRPW